MKLKSLLVSLAIVSGSTLFAQSMYELDYYYTIGNVKEEYKALLYCNGDGTGFIRVRFLNKDNNTEFLMGMEMKEEPERVEETNILNKERIFTGKNPYLLKGDSVLPYSADRYLFKINSQTGEFEPWGVVTVKNNQEYNGVYSQIKLVEMGDLNPAFVLQYFTKEDRFYKNLFPPIARGDNSPKGVRLHLISVTNTEDRSIGKTCVTDKNATLKIFSAIAETLKIPFSSNEVTGMEFSKKNVLNAITSTITGDNDIIVFYYSGHGYSKKNTPNLFPYLDLRINTSTQKLADEEINIEDIYKMIKAKKGRVKLVLSDCCNWGETMKSSLTQNVPGIRGSSLVLNPANCQALFIKPEPVSYLMTAASKGEVSAGTQAQGGFFTSQFRGSLEKYMGIGNTDPFSWTDIVTGTQTLTKNIAKGVSCPQPDNNTIYKPCKQTPLFKKD